MQALQGQGLILPRPKPRPLNLTLRPRPRPNITAMQSACYSMSAVSLRRSYASSSSRLKLITVGLCAFHPRVAHGLYFFETNFHAIGDIGT